MNSILLLGLFVALLLLFNPDFVSQSYANMGAMGGSSPKHDDDKKSNDGSPKHKVNKKGGGDGSPKHDDDKKGGGDGSPKHKKGGNDNNGGFSSPATTDNTPTQQTCLDGLAPLTASAICGSSQTPTDNIPSLPTGDLVIAGNPPAGVNCVSEDECLTPSGSNVANSGAAGSSPTQQPATNTRGPITTFGPQPPTQTDNAGGGDGATPTDTGATTGSTNQQQQQSVQQKKKYGASYPL